MDTLTILVPVTLTTQDIDDVMITASESGYEWIGDFTKTADGWRLTIEDAEEPGWWIDRTVSYAELGAAIATFFAGRAPRIRFSDEFAHQVDVNDADCIVQWACYGEIVFA